MGEKQKQITKEEIYLLFQECGMGVADAVLIYKVASAIGYLKTLPLLQW